HVQRAQPAPDLQGRLDLRRLGLAHAVLGAQLAEVGAHQAGEPPYLVSSLLASSRALSPRVPVRRMMASSSASESAWGPKCWSRSRGRSWLGISRTVAW